MAAVELGQLHEDKRPDGIPKRTRKYPITTLYKLNTPLYLKDQRLEGQNPQGPVYTTSKPDVKMTKLWSHQHEGILKAVTNPKEVFTLPHVFRTLPKRNAMESDGVRANFCGGRVSPHGLAGANLAETPMYRARTPCGVRAFHSDSARNGVGLVRTRTRAESED